MITASSFLGTARNLSYSSIYDLLSHLLVIVQSRKPLITPAMPTKHRPMHRSTNTPIPPPLAPLMVPKALLLIKQIRPRAAQVNNLGTAIAILLEPSTLKTIEGVADALAAADDALVLVVAEGAFVADADEGGGAHVRVADGAFAVALVA